MDTDETPNNAWTTSNASNSENVKDKHFVIAKCKRNTMDTLTKNTSDNQDTEESENEDRLLTVYYRSGKLGAACYTLQTGELQILEEIVDRPPEHQIFVSLFNQIEPVRIILEGKSQGTFVNVVKTILLADDSHESRCKLTFVSSKEYNFEACKRRIHSLSLPHEPAGCSDEERVVFLRTVVDFSQTQTVHALGAMLRYLDLNWSNLCMDLHGKPQFLTLKRISLNDIVAMDEDTFRGLQIFSSLSHPSGFKKGVQGSNKEGLSLFQMFSKCSSKVGHRRMRTLFRHPTKDIDTLNRRQEVIAYFMRPQSDSLMRNICSSLRFVKNVNGILAKIKALSAKAYQWKSLYNTLYNVVLICEMCESAGLACEYLLELAACDTNKLYEMALYMNRIIDFDLSKTEGKFTVKAGVDPDLDLKKQTMASLQGLMSETARAELNRLPPSVQECAMLYMPHLGYLLAVRAHEGGDFPHMRFMFQNNDYLHYKSKGCEELDVLIGDTYPEIVAHETRIMMRLTSILLENLHTLSAVIDKCAELDCLIAMSKVCKEHSYVRPRVRSSASLRVRAGRHPLCAGACVPNDAASGGAAGRVHVLTGPNASGKSVYVKQLGLIVYLAHIGSFVPAAEADIGAVSHIYSRIQSTECVAAHMSAFLIDLRQMALALQECSSSSLLLIDEFGKGTSDTDGLALLAACLNSALFRGERCPHVLAVTHYLHVGRYLVDSPLLRFLTPELASEGGAPLFLFRVRAGAAAASLALEVAAAGGLRGARVRRARRAMDAVLKNELPSPDKKITDKFKKITDAMKLKLLAEDI